MSEKAAEMIAQETLAQICQEGLLDLARLSPQNVKEVQANIQAAVFLGMRYAREACARKIEEGLSKIPEGVPPFMAAHAEQAFRSLADTMRATAIPIALLKTSLPSGPLAYTTPMREAIEAAARDAANDLLQKVGAQPPLTYPPGHAKAGQVVMVGLPRQGFSGVSIQFECHWCKEAGLPEAEYTKQGNPASTDFYDRPLCKECTDRLEPPPKWIPPTP